MSSASREPLLPPSEVIERLRSRVDSAVRYEDKGEVARGGMGSVRRVFDGDLRRTLAMKVMLDEPAGDGSASAASSARRRSARFLEEAQITGQLDHPGIVPVHELGLDAHGRLYFTMKLVKGRELREVFELVRDGREGWSLARALGVLLRVCEAMAFAHEKGVIHRDLKPANVMVGRFGEVYVMDWGLAKVLGRPDPHDVRLALQDASLTLVRTERKDLARATPDSPLATMDGDIVGTPCYMAPEQAKGRLEDIGPHSDVYSLGSMLYQLLAGSAPYVGGDERVSPHAVLGLLFQGPPRPLAEVAPRAPEELVAICAKAMAREPRERYPSMLGVAEDLRAYLEGRVVSAHESGAVAELRKWFARNRGFATATAIAVVVALGSAALITWQQLSTNAGLRSANAIAEAKKDEAEAARAQALASAQTAKGASYVANVAAAAAALRFHDTAGARANLEVCTDAELRGWEWRHLTAQCDLGLREVARFEAGADGRVPAVQSVAAAPDGSVLAAVVGEAGPLAGAPGGVLLVELASGRTLGELGPHGGSVLSVAFDPGGTRVATSCVDRTIRIFDVASRSLRASWSGKLGATSIAFGPDGRELAVAGLDKVLRVLDAQSGAVLRELHDRNGALTCVGFSSDGKRLAAGTVEGDVYVWSSAGGALERVLGDRGAAIVCIAFSPDGRRLAAAAGAEALAAPAREQWAETLREFDLASGRLVGVWHDHDDALTWCGYARHGRMLVSTSRDSTVRVRDTWHREDAMLLGHAGGVLGAAVVREDTLVTGGADGALREWDLAFGEALSIGAHRTRVDLLAFFHDGERLLSTSANEMVRVWNARTGLPVLALAGAGTSRIGAGSAVRAVALAPGDALLAVGLDDGRVQLYAPDSGAHIGELDAKEPEAVAGLAFADDGARLAVGHGGARVRVWDVARRELVATLGPTDGQPQRIAWLAGGSALATGTDKGTLSAWDLASGARTRLLEGLGESELGSYGGVTSLEALAGGARLLVGASDRQLRELDAATFEAARAAPAPPDLGPPMARVLGGLSTFDGGRRLLAASDSSGVAVLDARTLQPLLTLRGRGECRAVAGSADGRQIAAGFDDGVIRVWSSEPVRERSAQRRAELRARDLALPYVDALLRQQSFDLARCAAQAGGDEAVSEPLRAAALRLLRLCDGSTSYLRAECWDAVSLATAEPAARQLALWQAQRLQLLDPRDDRAALLEGAARYRRGEYALAEQCLRRSLELRRIGRAPPELSGFLAMTLQRLGRADEARAELARFQSAMSTPMQLANLANVELLGEAESVVAR